MKTWMHYKLDHFLGSSARYDLQPGLKAVRRELSYEDYVVYWAQDATGASRSLLGG